MRCQILCSKSTEPVARVLANLFEYSGIIVIDSGLLTREKIDVYKQSVTSDTILAIGGGSVIDAAKILAYPNMSYAIPTTASGSTETTRATLWADKKVSVETKKAHLVTIYKLMKINLEEHILNATVNDCAAHCIESLYSKNANKNSTLFANHAQNLLYDFTVYEHVPILIDAGIAAGMAIEITGTNIIHALSYALTTIYKIPHGIGCGLVMKAFDAYKTPGMKMFQVSVDYALDWERVIDEAMTYDQFNQWAGNVITKESLKSALVS